MKHKTRSTKHETRLGLQVFLSCFVLLALCFYFPCPVLSKKPFKPKTELQKEEKTQTKKEPIKINESEFESVLIGKLLENPQNYLDKKIKFRGKFSSFTTLALDYERALRKSKDYISLCIFRPDSKIPLAELKLAYPLKEAKEDEVIRELDEGDLLEIYGKVFSTALDEPWVDIVSLKRIGGPSKKENTLAQEKEENKPIKDNKKPKTNK